MTTLIDGYTGKYNGIDYTWKKQDDIYAIFSFFYNGQNVAKRIKNVVGKPLEEDIIRVISEMEIDYSLSQLENEKKMMDIMERLNHG